ncbi:MAG: DUF4150 domain-containing protein, partial [Alphaproteobacteria bacterium]|nr:DUF4150 domain-containing protein [Alphaproteobacteria bacterium]
KSGGKVVAFPDVCLTPAGTATVPIPYPNISQSSDLAKGSKKVKINGASVCLKDSEISKSTGDEAGSSNGVASGKTRGKATPVNYSMNVKIEGKNAVRNMDMFLGNNKNTPPFPILQANPAPSAPAVEKKEEEEKELCEYCGKEKHDFPEAKCDYKGSGPKLSKNIIPDITKHKWYSDPGSLQAHHLIPSQIIKAGNWPSYCKKFGYDINVKENGIMLPATMALACQLHITRHTGGHSKGISDIGLSYPKGVNSLLDDVKKMIENGDLCNSDFTLQDVLDDISSDVSEKIGSFTWTIIADGKDYQKGKQGCGGQSSVSAPKLGYCPHGRTHGLKNSDGDIIEPSKIKIGE